MATDVNFIIEQIEDEKDTWKVDHSRAMECRDLEEMIRRGLGFFHLIRLADDSWSRKVQTGAMKFEEKHARDFREKYEWWIAPCDQLLDEIEKAERQFGSVEGAEEFRRARAQTHAMLRVPIGVIIRGMVEN